MVLPVELSRPLKDRWFALSMACDPVRKPRGSSRAAGAECTARIRENQLRSANPLNGGRP